MANITTYLENKLLEHSLGKTAYDKPTATYAALFTSSPSLSNAGTEVIGANGYARQAVTWGTAASGQIANTEALTWTATGGSYSGGSTIKAIGIYDLITFGLGNLLYYGPLSANLIMLSGDTFNIPVGSLKITLT